MRVGELSALAALGISSGHEATLEEGCGITAELASLCPEVEAIEEDSDSSIGIAMEAAVVEEATRLALRSALAVAIPCDAFQVDSEVIRVCVDEGTSVSSA